MEKIKSNNFYCRLSATNNLSLTHPEIATQWHPFKNAITPKDVIAGSHKKAWWQCPSGHEWEAVIKDRKRFGCPYCSGNKVCLSNCLATVFPRVSSQWHPMKNGTLTPFNVTAKSNKKIWWICEKEKDHEWEAPINRRTNNLTGCPCCNGKTIVKSNCLETKYPDIAKEWHHSKNGSLKPSMVTPSSHTKVWWICPNGHEWKSIVKSRINMESGCPTCKQSHGEKLVEKILKKYNYDYSIQRKFKECKNKRKLPFDFAVIKNNKIYLIEYQGRQHYSPASFGSKTINAQDVFELLQKKDKIKRDFCKKNKIPLLAIPYLEKNVETKILNFLENIN